MKLIIDIPDEYFEQIKNNTEGSTAESEAVNAIRNGKPYDDRPQGELISREALMPLFIEKAQTMKDRHGVKLGENWLLDYNDIKDVIDSVPPAYIEPFANVTFDKEELNKIVEERIIEPIKRRELIISYDWVPVGERLPEGRINPVTNDFEYVLCSTIWKDVRPYKYGKPIGHDKAHFWHGGGIMDGAVIAWQPLPEPYKEGGTE